LNAQVNELAERLDNAEEDVDKCRRNIDAMDDVQEQVHQVHMNECLARGMAEKETARLKKENKSLQEAGGKLPSTKLFRAAVNIAICAYFLFF
jgi:chromosome segregation ATPase